jgi:hypothetical protein
LRKVHRVVPLGRHISTFVIDSSTIVVVVGIGMIGAITTGVVGAVGSSGVVGTAQAGSV